MIGHLIVRYDAATEFCDLLHPYNRRFHDLVKLGVKPLSFRRWNKLKRHWQVHITRLPMVVVFGKKFFGHVDYSDLPSPIQIELVRQVQEAEQHVRREKFTTRNMNIVPLERAYRILHLLPTAPPEVVRAAYKALALLLHPDTGGDEEAFKHLQKAYEVLTKGQQ
jgi:hypothetical protein